MPAADPLYLLPLEGADADALAQAVLPLGAVVEVVRELPAMRPDDTLLVLAAPSVRAAEALARVHALEVERGWRHAGVLLLGPPPLHAAESVADDPALLEVADPPTDPARLAWALARARRTLLERREIDQLTARVRLQGREMQEVNRIGVALSAERDSDRLLDLILRKSREITGADAGSLYLIEPRPGAEEVPGEPLAAKQLRFRLAQNDSRSVPFRQFVIGIDRGSVAGHVAISGSPLSLDDVYNLPPDSPFSFNRSFDEATGYRTRSMLVVPMRTQRDETIGVVQLINRKRQFASRLRDAAEVEREVVPFDAKCQELASSLASQAAVSLENARLYEEIRELFDGFIRASVTAIESRDPTTSGHSERVADLTVGLTEAVDRTEGGVLGGVRFSAADIQEVRFASLLHDFGKIGVREPVLVKEKKLFGHELDLVRQRFALIRRGIELHYSRRMLELALAADRAQAAQRFPELQAECSALLGRVDRYLDLVVRSNEPTVLDEGGFEALIEIGGQTFVDPQGEANPYLTPEELARLSIRRGSLSREEREEIESHVTHTYNFLRQIPWSRDLRGVPEIAFAHHEKLNGTGYPRKLTAVAIPLQSKMMAISDIYDALTANDRPYKRAVPTTRALDILADEVKHGKLDADLFQVFLAAKVFEKVPVVGG
jgi:HD-GYP domain-containing protein (c-di-GMP phosphodiesterase class II)